MKFPGACERLVDAALYTGSLRRVVGLSLCWDLEEFRDVAWEAFGLTLEREYEWESRAGKDDRFFTAFDCCCSSSDARDLGVLCVRTFACADFVAAM